MTPFMAAPAISTVGSFELWDCAAEVLSPVVMSSPQPESRTTAGNISSPCFDNFLPQIDIVAHHFIDEFRQIIPGRFSVICGLVQDLAGGMCQEVGAYGGIHLEIERNTVRERCFIYNLLLFSVFLE